MRTRSSRDEAEAGQSRNTAVTTAGTPDTATTPTQGLAPAPDGENRALDVLVPAGIPDVAGDRAERSVRLPDAIDDPAWQPAAIDGLSIRVLELVRGEGRLTAQLAPAGDAVDALELGRLPGAELLLQRGQLWRAGREFPAGSWLRLPRGRNEALRLSADALVLVSVGQIRATDEELRTVDTTDDDAWLDGPVAGIEVLPLHGQGSGNVMLVRWRQTAAFRPNLDPVGDEVFVLGGTLHDANGSFTANSWVRNPVPTWQSWAGTPGTLICYKSGHFVTVPDVDSVPAATRPPSGAPTGGPTGGSTDAPPGDPERS